MGQEKSSSQKTSKIQINQFPVQNKVVLQTIQYLLKTKQFKKLNQKEAQVSTFGQKFKFKTISNVNELHKYSGFAQIYNKENMKIFQGQFINGNRNGFGIQYDLNGNTLYQGQFYKNLYHGWGVTPKYQGQYVKGNKTGWGVFEDIDKNGISRFFYEGFWLDNYFHGIGSLNVRSDGIEVFLQDNVNINLGNYDVKYVGQWQNGMINGSGKMVKKGQIYTGEFIDGNYEGDGILLSQHKPMIKGKFLQGKLLKKQ